MLHDHTSSTAYQAGLGRHSFSFLFAPNDALAVPTKAKATPQGAALQKLPVHLNRFKKILSHFCLTTFLHD